MIEWHSVRNQAGLQDIRLAETSQRQFGLESFPTFAILAYRVPAAPQIPALRLTPHAGTLRGANDSGQTVREETIVAEKSSRSRAQDRARVAGRQDYEVRYESKKTGKSKSAVKSARKKAGPSRKKIERELGR
jgi:uncharacterized protein DUF3606